MTKPLIYLASPYSDPDPAVMARRAKCVTAVTARLLKEGKHVFSPIAYAHQFAVEHGMGTDWETWKEFGTAMLEKCNRFMILEIPGWVESLGVDAEYKAAFLRGSVFVNDVMLQPTPEELAILDEPKEESKEESKECKWYDSEVNEEYACTKPYCIAQGHPECLSNAGLMSDCEYFEPKEEPTPITQPEPKCKFWSDEDQSGGSEFLHCRCKHVGVTKQGFERSSRCYVVCPDDTEKATTDCKYFQPADEPEPTAEEKIIEGLEEFADELEAGKVVVHPCRFYDGDFKPDTLGCSADWIHYGIKTPSVCAWINEVNDGISPDSWAIDCARFKPREIPPPEYDPKDVAFTAVDKLNILVDRVRKAQADLAEAMAKIRELTRKESK